MSILDSNFLTLIPPKERDSQNLIGPRKQRCLISNIDIAKQGRSREKRNKDRNDFEPKKLAVSGFRIIMFHKGALKFFLSSEMKNRLVIFSLAIFGSFNSGWAVTQATEAEIEQWKRDLASNNVGTYERAAQAIGKLGPAGADAIPILIQTLPKDQRRVGFATHEAAKALGRIGAPALPAVLTALESSDTDMQLGAMDALGELGPLAKSAVPQLLDILRKRHADHRVAPVAAEAIGKIGEIQPLMDVLDRKDSTIQKTYAMQGLGAAGASAASAVPLLIQVLASNNSPDHMVAANALGNIGAAAGAAIPRLAELSESGPNYVRRAAGEALAKIGTPEALTAAKPYESRKKLWDGFFHIMSLFIWMPWLAGMIGIAFAVLARVVSNRLLYVPSVIWLLYCGWEYHCQSKGANIRIDLGMLYPVLAVVSAASLVIAATTSFLRSRRSVPK